MNATIKAHGPLVVIFLRHKVTNFQFLPNLKVLISDVLESQKEDKIKFLFETIIQSRVFLLWMYVCYVLNQQYHRNTHENIGITSLTKQLQYNFMHRKYYRKLVVFSACIISPRKNRPKRRNFYKFRRAIQTDKLIKYHHHRDGKMVSCDCFVPTLIKMWFRQFELSFGSIN